MRCSNLIGSPRACGGNKDLDISRNSDDRAWSFDNGGAWVLAVQERDELERSA